MEIMCVDSELISVHPEMPICGAAKTAEHRWTPMPITIVILAVHLDLDDQIMESEPLLDIDSKLNVK